MLAAGSGAQRQIEEQIDALGLLGGALGVGAGAGMAVLMSRTAGWAVHVSPESILLAVAFSLGVGLFFGLLPDRPRCPGNCPRD